MTTTPIAEGRVLIVIPCFNQRAMLCETLASIQQVRNANLLEVIIVDDGSSEAQTRNILNGIRDAGYRVVSQPEA